MKFLFKYYPFNRFILFHIATIAGLYYMWDPTYLLLSVIGYFLFAIVGFEIGIHRYYSHQSFTCNKFVEYLLLFLSILSCSASPKEFATLHKVHHRVPDTLDDPHIAGTNILAVWCQLFNRPRPNRYDVVLNKKLTDHWLYKVVDRQQLTIYYGIVLLTSLILGVKFAFYFLILGGLLAMHGYSTLNILCHRFGYRNHTLKDKSTNNPVCFWLCGGQWHNNHHKNAWKYTTKELPNEHDIAGWIIKHILSTSVKE